MASIDCESALINLQGGVKTQVVKLCDELSEIVNRNWGDEIKGKIENLDPKQRINFRYVNPFELFTPHWRKQHWNRIEPLIKEQLDKWDVNVQSYEDCLTRSIPKNDPEKAKDSANETNNGNGSNGLSSSAIYIVLVVIVAIVGLVIYKNR